MSITSDELKNISDSELATIQASNHHQSEEYILAEKEWQRRERLKQHELDLVLMSKQVRAMKFSAILGVVAVLAGAIVGAIIAPWLQYKLSKQLQTTKEVSSQYKTESNLEVLQMSQVPKTPLKLQNNEKAKKVSSQLPPE